MKKLGLLLVLIASIHAETWNCTTLVVADEEERIEHEIPSTLTIKGASLSLAVKGVSPRSYHFLRDSLEGDRYYKKDKGEGLVLISGDIFVVLDGRDDYFLRGCVK